MSRSVSVWLLLLALVGGLFVAACGGSDDDDNGDEPTAVETMADGDTTPSDNGDNGSSSIEDFAGDLDVGEMTVSYDVTSAGETSTFKVYWKDGTHWRLDIVSGDSSTMIIQNDDGSFFCDPSSESCISSPGGVSAIPIPFFAAFTQENGLANYVTGAFGGFDAETSNETIAGHDATCYKVSGVAEGESGFAEICAADNIVLRWEAGSAGDSVKIEATSAESSVSDSDLELPYPATDLGDLQP
jgi:hypothetical protein